MWACPRCRRRLVRARSEQGFFFRCPGCDGRAVGLAVLRKTVPRETIHHLWAAARRPAAGRGAGCPVCQRPMREVAVPVAHGQVALDVCTACQFVWFDTQELAQLPARPAGPGEEPGQLPERVRQAMAEADRKLDELRRRQSEFGSEPPEQWWKIIPALLGMPVEQEVNPVRTLPWVTWGLVAAMIVVYLITFPNLAEVVTAYGLIPAVALRYGGLTLVTSFFLHAGLLHLIGNAYFLLIFGDNVEDHLGRWRYGLLIGLAALVGDLAHIAANPHDVVPCVGASGGISGVIVFYALKFPHARLGFLFYYWFYFRWLHVPAWFALIGWLVLQGITAYYQLAGSSSVSALAHLGGAAVGFAAWAVWREGRVPAGEAGAV